MGHPASRALRLAPVLLFCPLRFVQQIPGGAAFKFRSFSVGGRWLEVGRKGAGHLE